MTAVITPPTLTELTSLNLLQNLQKVAIPIALATTSLETVETQTILTSYVKQGQAKPPILLLHGFDSSVLEFRRLLPQLADHRQTWAIDLLGFGFTERSPDLDISPATIKAHLYSTWKTLIQEPIVLVGVSMGGAVAIDFSLTYPEVVSQLVLIDSAGLANPPLAARWMFPPIDRWATNFLANPQIRQRISRAAYHDPAFASVDAQTCTSLHLNCDRWHESLIAFTKSGGYGSFAALLPTLLPSTLIIWGEEDKILGTKAATKFQQRIPQSRLCWIPECGHVPHLEKATETATAILDFIT